MKKLILFFVLIANFIFANVFCGMIVDMPFFKQVKVDIEFFDKDSLSLLKIFEFLQKIDGQIFTVQENRRDVEYKINLSKGIVFDDKLYLNNLSHDIRSVDMGRETLLGDCCDLEITKNNLFNGVMGGEICLIVDPVDESSYNYLDYFCFGLNTGTVYKNTDWLKKYFFKSSFFEPIEMQCRFLNKNFLTQTEAFDAIFARIQSFFDLFASGNGELCRICNDYIVDPFLFGQFFYFYVGNKQILHKKLQNPDRLIPLNVLCAGRMWQDPYYEIHFIIIPVKKLKEGFILDPKFEKKDLVDLIQPEEFYYVPALEKVWTRKEFNAYRHSVSVGGSDHGDEDIGGFAGVSIIPKVFLGVGVLTVAGIAAKWSSVQNYFKPKKKSVKKKKDLED